MLTRFFGTAKPLAVVVVIIYMSLGFFYSNRQWVTTPFNWQETLALLGMWLLFISTMFILNFVTQKNDLTRRSTYGILLFAAFSLALPVALRDGAILLSGFFILIALRRIISFKSELYMERKIFDATIWILLASVAFYFSWLYLIAIYLALLLYNISNTRYLVIPFIGLISFAVIYYSFLLIQAGSPGAVNLPFESVSLDFSIYNKLEILIAVAFFIALLLWTVWRYLKEQRNASSSAKPRYAVILALLAVSILVIILSANKTGAECYVIIPVMTVIVSNFLEQTESPVFKESLLWLIVLLPVFIHYIA